MMCIRINVSTVRYHKPNMSLVQVWDQDVCFLNERSWCSTAQTNCSLWLADITSCYVAFASWSMLTLQSQAPFRGASGKGAFSLNNQPVGSQRMFQKDTPPFFTHWSSSE